MARILSVINNKGGTGKTTTVLNLGAALQRRRQRVLLVDLDSQCNLSSSLGVNRPAAGIGELLTGATSFDDTIAHAGKMDLLPANEQLLDCEFRLNGEPGREFVLREVLSAVAERYDYILIDCPPSLGTLAINSLVAADRYIVPMQAENFAFIGLDRILSLAEKVAKRMNPNLQLGGILFVKLNPRTHFSRAMIQSLSQDARLKGRLFNTYIRQDIALMESAAFHKCIFDYAPKSKGSSDYRDLAKEVAAIYG